MYLCYMIAKKCTDWLLWFFHSHKVLEIEMCKPPLMYHSESAGHFHISIWLIIQNSSTLFNIHFCVILMQATYYENYLYVVHQINRSYNENHSYS